LLNAMQSATSDRTCLFFQLEQTHDTLWRRRTRTMLMLCQHCK
jgi:hypothetical protein